MASSEGRDKSLTDIFGDLQLSDAEDSLVSCHSIQRHRIATGSTSDLGTAGRSVQYAPK